MENLSNKLYPHFGSSDRLSVVDSADEDCSEYDESAECSRRNSTSEKQPLTGDPLNVLQRDGRGNLDYLDINTDGDISGSRDAVGDVRKNSDGNVTPIISVTDHAHEPHFDGHSHGSNLNSGFNLSSQLNHNNDNNNDNNGVINGLISSKEESDTILPPPSSSSTPLPTSAPPPVPTTQPSTGVYQNIPAATSSSSSSDPTASSATPLLPATATTTTPAANSLLTVAPPGGAATSVSRQSSFISDVSSARGSLDNISTASSLPDFHMLKSAMKKSSEEDRAGKRRLSLFNTVMRRVSIHRKESTPTGRIATFLFGVDDKPDATTAENKEDDEENGGTNFKTPMEKKKAHAAQLRESLFLILSGLYGIIIVILGAVIPITEIFISDDVERAFEAFYVYLYMVSILFLGYVYAYLLRRNRLKTELLTRTLSRSLSWTKASRGRSWDRSRGAENDARSKHRKRMISLDVSNHHTGTFYLRLGVLGFGIGSMIHSGLNFGTYFSVSDESCNEPIQAIKPMIHLVFTFFQLYFIFMNSKMCIHRYKKLARFGLMHMCATNICVWFRSIVVETLHVIHMQHAAHAGGHGGGHDTMGVDFYHNSDDDHGGGDGHHGGHGADGHGVVDSHGAESHDYHHDPHLETLADAHDHMASYNLLNASSEALGHVVAATNGNESKYYSSLTEACQWSDMMGQAVEAAGPYLYPCTIEYSLMCAGILYIMWKNVGKRPRRPRGSELGGDDDDDHQRVHRMSVDCTSSSRGLFLGILLMVGTIISIIAFYMMVSKDDMRSSSGLILTHVSETAIYTLTLIALIMAAIRMKVLTFHNEHEADLEDILILISYTGLLAFIIFSLIASILSPPDVRSGLTVLSNVTMLIQATVQTIFMLAGDRMTASTDAQERKKPGREFITFLLISNFAMWAINTFETQTPQHNPIQVEFYGPEAWAIFTHISVPLGIYYRFHSTVCFSNIWKNAWKKRKHH